MTKRTALFLAALAFIALAVIVYRGQDNSAIGDPEIWVNNHTGAAVLILDLEEVTVQRTPLVTHQVVVYVFLSGPVDVLQGERRWEMHNFVRHFHPLDVDEEFTPVQTTSPTSHSARIGAHSFLYVDNNDLKGSFFFLYRVAQ